jgi:hypothetical protein
VIYNQILLLQVLMLGVARSWLHSFTSIVTIVFYASPLVGVVHEDERAQQRKVILYGYEDASIEVHDNGLCGITLVLFSVSSVKLHLVEERTNFR